MSAEASHFYRADLGQPDESSERIFQAWVDSQRHKHVLVKEDDGTVVLFAERKEERQQKDSHGSSEDNDKQLENTGTTSAWLSALAFRDRVPRGYGKLAGRTTDRGAHGDRIVVHGPSATSRKLRYGAGGAFAEPGL